MIALRGQTVAWSPFGHGPVCDIDIFSRSASAISIVFCCCRARSAEISCQGHLSMWRAQHRQPSGVVFPLKGGGALTRASWAFLLLARALGWWPRPHSHARPRTCRVTCDNFFKIVSQDSTDERYEDGTAYHQTSMNEESVCDGMQHCA